MEKYEYVSKYSLKQFVVDIYGTREVFNRIVSWLNRHFVNIDWRNYVLKVTTDADDVVAAASKIRHQQNHDQRVWDAYLKANKVNQIPSPNSCVIKGDT